LRDESKCVFWCEIEIKLDDERFPCNSAHFRLSDCSYNEPHTCFVPPGQPLAKTPFPFVTLYDGKKDTPCTSLLLLLKSDIVYGDCTEPEGSGLGRAEITYPAGTVLIYPNSVVPKKDEKRAPNRLGFLMFQPCPVGLLRGAVPVGHM